MFTYLFFRFLIFIFRLVPFSLLYKISDGVSWLFYKVVHYRRDVVIANLKNSFPEKSDTEIKEICRKSYTNLSDIMLESFKGFSMSENIMRERFKVLNPELINNETNANGFSLQVAAHYANWEWGALAYSLYIYKQNICFYKPLSNKFIDVYVRKQRSAGGMTLVSIKNTAQIFKDFTTTNTAPATFLLVSDQSPTSPKSHWVKFLNQDTACLHGADEYARLYDLPVYYIDIQRISRGFYSLNLKLLTTEPRKFPPQGITQLFMCELEKIIRHKPEDWLWTHKRWKIKREN